MNVLLDTHAFLWFIEGSSRLSHTGVETIRDPETELYLSIASLWEIAIKASIGRLPLIQPFDVLIPDQLARHDIHILPNRCSASRSTGVATGPPSRSLRSSPDCAVNRRATSNRQRRSSVRRIHGCATLVTTPIPMAGSKRQRAGGGVTHARRQWTIRPG